MTGNRRESRTSNRLKQATKQQDSTNRSPFWPVAYRWLATGTLVAYTAVGMTRVLEAQQQRGASGEPGGSGAPQNASLLVRRFDIPAGTLGTVLPAFEAASGLHVVTPNKRILPLESPGVSSVCTVESALKQLLSGTGAGSRFTAADTVVIDIEAVLTTIQVTETASQLETSSPKYSAPLRDTPQTVTVVPKAIMEQQAATTLRDALRNVAGISLAAGEGGAQGDNLTIRGFSARNDLFIDGMRDFGSYYRDPYNIEEVQVLQGPSSVTFGRGSTGGVVNQSSKSPMSRKLIGGDLQFGTDRTRRATLDLNQPTDGLAAGSAFRLNLMGHENDVAGRDGAHNRRYGIAPSMAFGLGTATTWNFSYVRQGADDTPDYGIPWLFNSPAPVNRRNYYGFPDDNYLRTTAGIGTARVEHMFNPNATLRNQLRYASYDRQVRITEGRVVAGVTAATPLPAVTVNRNQIDVSSKETMLMNQTDGSLLFKTGPLHHTLVSGVELSRETSSPLRHAWSGVPGTSLLNPDPSQPFAGTSAISSQVKTDATSVAGYFLDTVRISEKLEVAGGLRWDRFNADYRQMVGNVSSFHRIDRMASWRAGVVYKPSQNGSVYVNASTSFNPSAESLSLSASTANLPPEKNRTYEAGTKWDLHAGRLSLRGAIFRTGKLNAREPDPNNSLLNVLAGSQRVDGVQGEVTGHLTRRWDVLTGYAWLDARVMSSNYYPAAIGAMLANVPRNTFNFWSTWRLPKRWDLGAGTNFVGTRTASSTAPFDPVTGLVKQAPGYWVFNAMIRHPLTEHVELQANLNNLTNRYYYDLLHPGHIVVGPGRSVLGGIRFHF